MGVNRGGLVQSHETHSPAEVDGGVVMETPVGRDRVCHWPFETQG